MKTNKLSLLDVQKKLEQRNFRCIENSGIFSLIGVLSECRWNYGGVKFDILIFVNQIKGDLTMEKIEHDLRALPEAVLDQQIDGCPPFGFHRGRMILLVYLLSDDQGEIKQQALDRILSAPAKEWSSVTFVAAQDGAGKSCFFESYTPFWGKLLYPELRYWASLVTGRTVSDQLPTSGKFWATILCFSLIFLYGTSVLIAVSGDSTSIRQLLTSSGVAITLMLVMLVFVYSVQWYRSYRRTYQMLLNGDGVPAPVLNLWRNKPEGDRV